MFLVVPPLPLTHQPWMSLGAWNFVNVRFDVDALIVIPPSVTVAPGAGSIVAVVEAFTPLIFNPCLCAPEFRQITAPPGAADTVFWRFAEELIVCVQEPPPPEPEPV